MSRSHEVSIECLVELPDGSDCMGELTFDVEPGHPGRVYGDPYYCYEPEGPLADFVSDTCGHWASADAKQQLKWEAEACDVAAEQDLAAYEDAMERKYEDARERAWDRGRDD